MLERVKELIIKLQDAPLEDSHNGISIENRDSYLELILDLLNREVIDKFDYHLFKLNIVSDLKNNNKETKDDIMFSLGNIVKYIEKEQLIK